MTSIVLSFLGSLCPAILYNVHKKRFFWAGLSGVFGWVVYDYINQYTGQVVLATFIGSIIVGLYSEVIARIIKAPALIFSVSGIFPLVPGLGAYETAKLILDQNIMGGITKGLETFASAGSIAIGIMLMSGAFKASKSLKGKRKMYIKHFK